MSLEPNTLEDAEVPKEKHPVFQVTKTSKYLAMLLFILMPLIGGWIGYTYAPEKVVIKTEVRYLDPEPTIGVTPIPLSYAPPVTTEPIEAARQHLLAPAQTDIADFNLDEDAYPRDMLYPGGPLSKTISLEEVIVKNSRDNCWVVYSDGVHDITLLFELENTFSAIGDLGNRCGTDVTEYIESQPVEAGSLNTARFRYALSEFWAGYWIES